MKNLECTLCILVSSSLSSPPHHTPHIHTSHLISFTSHLTPHSPVSLLTTPASQEESPASQEEILACWEKQQPETPARVPGLGQVVRGPRLPVLGLRIQVPGPWSRSKDQVPAPRALVFFVCLVVSAFRRQVPGPGVRFG